MNAFFEFRSNIQRVKDAANILADRHGSNSRVTIIGTRHLLIAWHWRPADRASVPGT